MISIYHNPRCRKSREGLAILQESGKEFTIIPYMDKPPGSSEIRELLQKLGITAKDLIRKQEPLWKKESKGKNYTEEQLISLLAKYPKLIERPIVVNDERAVVGRPPEKIREFLNY